MISPVKTTAAHPGGTVDPRKVQQQQQQQNARGLALTYSSPRRQEPFPTSSSSSSSTFPQRRTTARTTRTTVPPPRPLVNVGASPSPSPSGKNDRRPKWFRFVVHSSCMVQYTFWSMVVFGPLAVLVWMHHVSTTYLEPQFATLQWTADRQYDEMTYYYRSCTVDDVSTQNPLDLYLLPRRPEQRPTMDKEDTTSTSTSTSTTNNNNTTTTNNTIYDTDAWYDHQLRHGFSVIPHALSDETCRVLRHYIQTQNQVVGKDYFVLENDHRYSFGLDTNVPIVAQAMQELTNPHQPLSQLVEKVMGPHAALIEMTAITVSAGAVNQDYHDDIVPATSALLYGRSFTPLWSIFVQLQDTTAAMGATGICPGLHYCTSGNIGDDICESADNDGGAGMGFSMIIPELGYWPAGDALLMNMNSYHRGSAHTDKTAPDRVMVILTIGPHPRPRAESRQISQGATMSLRHDLWGHSWTDLQRAAVVMQRPWSLLRSYGLYHAFLDKNKKNNNNNNQNQHHPWGYDYITNLYMRIANDPNFFTADTLEEEMEEGDMWLFSQNKYWDFLVPELTEDELEEDTAWFTFLQALLRRLVIFQSMVCLVVVTSFGTYQIGQFLVRNRRTQPIPNNNHDETDDVDNDDTAAVRRFAVTALVVYTCYVAARRHVDETQWARDLQTHRLYHSVYDDEGGNYVDIAPYNYNNHQYQFQSYPSLSSPSSMTKTAAIAAAAEGISTYPTKYDILYEYRLGSSPYLHLFQDIIDQGHYGNRRLHRVVQQVVLGYHGHDNEQPELKTTTTQRRTQTTSFPAVVEFARPVLVQRIWNQVRHGNGNGNGHTDDKNGGTSRFLQQGSMGRWFLISHDESWQRLDELLLRQYQFPVLDRLLPLLQAMQSEGRFGYYRSTALAYRHLVPYARYWHQRLVSTAQTRAETVIRTKPVAANHPWRGRPRSEQRHCRTKSQRTRPSQVVAMMSNDHSTFYRYDSQTIDSPTTTNLSSCRDNDDDDDDDDHADNDPSHPFLQRSVVASKQSLPIMSNLIWVQQKRRRAGGSSFFFHQNNPNTIDDTRPVPEPEEGAWLHTGSYVEAQKGPSSNNNDNDNTDWYYIGKITNIFPDYVANLETLEGSHGFELDYVEPLENVQSVLFGKYVQVRVPVAQDENDDDDTEDEDNDTGEEDDEDEEEDEDDEDEEDDDIVVIGQTKFALKNCQVVAVYDKNNVMSADTNSKDDKPADHQDLVTHRHYFQNQHGRRRKANRGGTMVGNTILVDVRLEESGEILPGVEITRLRRSLTAAEKKILSRRQEEKQQQQQQSEKKGYGS